MLSPGNLGLRGTYSFARTFLPVTGCTVDLGCPSFAGTFPTVTGCTISYHSYSFFLVHSNSSLKLSIAALFGRTAYM